MTESAGYRYRGKDFQVLFVTSVPRTDDQAVAYMATVSYFFDANTYAIYVERREPGTMNYKMLPVMFNKATGQMVEISQE